MSDVDKKLDQWGPLDARLLYMSFWFEPAAFGSGRRFGAQWPEIFGLFENFRTTYVWDKSSMEKAGTNAIKNIFLISEKRKNLWQIYLETKKELNALSADIESSVVLNVESKIIREKAVKLASLIKSMWEIGVTPEVANFGAPTYLEKELKGLVPKEKISDVLEVLLTPEDFSFHQKSEKELLELFLRFDGVVPEQELENYSKQWHWIENDYFGSKYLSAKYFKDFLENLSKDEVEKKLESIKKYLAEVKDRKQKVFDQYNLPDNIKFLSSVLSHSIWWQDDRKGVAWRVHGVLDIVSNWAVKFFGVSFDSLMLYRAEEWEQLLKKGIFVSEKVIEEREELTIFVLNKEGVVEYRGEEAKELKLNIFLLRMLNLARLKSF